MRLALLAFSAIAACSAPATPPAACAQYQAALGGALADCEPHRTPQTCDALRRALTQARRDARKAAYRRTAGRTP